MNIKNCPICGHYLRLLLVKEAEENEEEENQTPYFQ